MAEPKSKDVSTVCPCCGARLRIDTHLGKVVSYESPPRHSNSAPDLARAGALLREQAERREALFRQSTEDEKIKSQVLERKFEAALERSKEEPLQKPTRDIDLD
jgi:hypothetical protein